MRRLCLTLSWLALVFLPSAVRAQDAYKIEAHKKAPPQAASAEIRGTLQGEGYKIVSPQGKTFAELWLRKAVPASAKPAGAKGAIQFPFLAEGELLGVLEFTEEGHDYRDQTIPKGVYTVRYGLQPVNGDHLGVSQYRDYVLLIPAGKDADPATLSKKPLEERSSESAGASHPAVFLLVGAPAGGNGPTVVRDEEKDTWGAVVPLPLEVKGGSGTTPFPVQLIIVGVSMA